MTPDNAMGRLGDTGDTAAESRTGHTLARDNTDNTDNTAADRDLTDNNTDCHNTGGESSSVVRLLNYCLGRGSSSSPSPASSTASLSGHRRLATIKRSFHHGTFKKVSELPDYISFRIICVFR